MTGRNSNSSESSVNTVADVETGDTNQLYAGKELLSDGQFFLIKTVGMKMEGLRWPSQKFS